MNMDIVPAARYCCFSFISFMDRIQTWIWVLIGSGWEVGFVIDLHYLCEHNVTGYSLGVICLDWSLNLNLGVRVYVCACEFICVHTHTHTLLPSVFGCTFVSIPVCKYTLCLNLRGRVWERVCIYLSLFLCGCVGCLYLCVHVLAGIHLGDTQK